MKKTVLVTGSSRGIGRAVALKFASCGYRVVINCARSAERMEEVKKEIESLGAECLAVQADVGDPDDCKRLFQEIESRFGHVDVLVNNAGISIIGLLQDLSFEDWNRILSANLRLPLREAGDSRNDPQPQRKDHQYLLRLGRLRRFLRGGLLRHKRRRQRSHHGPRQGTRPLRHSGERYRLRGH